MKITVIVPSYKPKSYLWECLNSIYNQTFSKSNYEVILILNGCNEPFKSEIAEYIDSDLKGLSINFIHTNTPGVSNARNIGIENAKGEYITFIDDDDYVSPGYLQELYETATQGYVSLSNIIAFHDNGPIVEKHYMTKLFRKKQSKQIKSIMEVRSFFSTTCFKLLHKEMIKDCRFNENFKNGEDSLFMFLISNRMKRIKFSSDKAIYYRRYRDDSAVFTQSRVGIMKNSIKIMKEYTIIYMQKPTEYNLFFYLSRMLSSLIRVIKGF